MARAAPTPRLALVSEACVKTGMIVYSCTYFRLNDENPKEFQRGFWTQVAYVKTEASRRPVIGVKA